MPVTVTQGAFERDGRTHQGEQGRCQACDQVLYERHQGCCGTTLTGVYRLGPHLCTPMIAGEPRAAL